jgi:aminoacrylate peracid reductase
MSASWHRTGGGFLTLKDWAGFNAINAVYAEFLPVRYCVQVGLARPDLLVEIASIAHVDAR